VTPEAHPCGRVDRFSTLKYAASEVRWLDRDGSTLLSKAGTAQ